MRRRSTLFAVMLVAGVCVIAGARRPYAAQPTDATLPAAGTVSAELPAGGAAMTVRTRCVVCHAADMLLQQRLTRPQWAAEIDKMQRWGSPIRDDEKAAVLDYLVAVAERDNARFTSRPVAPSR